MTQFYQDDVSFSVLIFTSETVYSCNPRGNNHKEWDDDECAQESIKHLPLYQLASSHHEIYREVSSIPSTDFKN